MKYFVLFAATCKNDKKKQKNQEKIREKTDLVEGGLPKNLVKEAKDIERGDHVGFTTRRIFTHYALL